MSMLTELKICLVGRVLMASDFGAFHEACSKCPPCVTERPLCQRMKLRLQYLKRAETLNDFHAVKDICAGGLWPQRAGYRGNGNAGP